MSEMIAENKERIEKGEINLIKFHAKWCGPCKAYDPVFTEFCLTYRLNGLSVDIDKESEYASEMDIRTLPTTIFLNNGKEVYRESGIMTEENLKETYSKYC